MGLFWYYFVRRMLCRIVGHPGVYRQWEWYANNPMWVERTDAWSCIRCEADIPTPPTTLPHYKVARPTLTADMIDHVNEVIEEHGPFAVRLRGGDPTTKRGVVPLESSENEHGQDESL